MWLILETMLSKFSLMLWQLQFLWKPFQKNRAIFTCEVYRGTEHSCAIINLTFDLLNFNQYTVLGICWLTNKNEAIEQSDILNFKPANIVNDVHFVSSYLCSHNNTLMEFKWKPLQEATLRLDKAFNKLLEFLDPSLSGLKCSRVLSSMNFIWTKRVEL